MITAKRAAAFALSLAMAAALTACGTSAPANSGSGDVSVESTEIIDYGFKDTDLKGIFDIPVIHVIQNATGIDLADYIAQNVRYDDSIIKGIRLAEDSELDTTSEHNGKVSFVVTVNAKILADELGLDGDYTGLSEITVKQTVKVVRSGMADEILASDGSAVILDTDNAVYTPSTDTATEPEGGTETPTDTTEPTDGGTDTAGTEGGNGDGNTAAGNNTGNNTGNTGSSTGTTTTTGSNNKTTSNTGSNTGKTNTSNTGSNTGSSTGTTTTHTHDWKPVYTTVHHDEVGHNETKTVVVQEAYDEPVYTSGSVCNKCNWVTTSHGTEIDLHILNEHGGAASYRIDTVQTGTTHHDAVTQEQTTYVVDQAAYDEQVVSGYKCSCGATK